MIKTDARDKGDFLRIFLLSAGSLLHAESQRLRNLNDNS
jgi:hypothetical protein